MAISKEKLKAAGKIAFGVYEIGSSAVMATGHGLVGAYLKRHDRMGAALALANRGMREGKHSLDAGLRDWKNAD